MYHCIFKICWLDQQCNIIAKDVVNDPRLLLYEKVTFHIQFSKVLVA